MRITYSLQCSVKKNEKNKYKRSHVYARHIYAGENILLLFSIAFMPLAEDGILISRFSIAYSMKP